MSSKLSIRITKDLELISRLDKQTFGEDHSLACHENYDDPGVVWWVAWVNGEPAGFAGLRILSGHNSGIGYLRRAGVCKAYRGFGMQKRLIKARTNYAKRAGLREVCTYTERYNYASANSLVGCGYRMYTPAGPWGLKDAIYFRKILEK